MTVFAGVIGSGYYRPSHGQAEAMLSYVVAPSHTKLTCFSDKKIQVAAKQRAHETDFFEDEDICVVACGRLHTIGAISDLHQGSVEFHGIGETVASAYKKWGASLAQNLIGEFAFAVWDKNEQLLLCARDRFGQIPLSYRATEEGFAFASDFISVAMGFSTRPEPNDDWIIGYLNEAVLDQDSTPFMGVRKLPPGSLITWRNNELKLRQYWSFNEIGPTFPELSISDLYSELNTATENRMIDTKSATMLSGGLDSSSIALIARDIWQTSNDGLFPAVSLVFDEFPDETERPYIETILKTGGFKPHFVNAQEYDVVSEISRHVRVQGAPHHGVGTPIHDQAISELARLGFTSVLDGHGGDEIISSGGVMRYFELANEGKWFGLLRELIQASNYSKINILGNFIGLYGLKREGFTARIARKLHRKLYSSSTQQTEAKLINLDWETHPSNSVAQQIANASMPASHVTERSYQQNVLSAPLQSNIFEVLHRLFRSRGIRAEFPFWDQKIVELCVRAPSNYKLNNGQPRSLIRSVMKDRLPPMIASRDTKHDFADAHIRSFQAAIGQLREFAEISDHKTFEYVDREVFSSAIDQLQSAHKQQRVAAHEKIWLTINLFLWFEMLAEYDEKLQDQLERPC